MDDHQDPEDVPEPIGSPKTRDAKPQPAVEERTGDETGPDPSEAPEEEGSASPG